MRKRYKGLNNKKYRLQYHIIFSTKYRRKLLEHLKEDLFESFKKVELPNFRILLMETDQDHVHFLIEASLAVSIDKIVKILKQRSTYDTWKNHENYMKSYYWGNKRHLWTRGYFVASIGEASGEVILNYIKNQG